MNRERCTALPRPGLPPTPPDRTQRRKATINKTSIICGYDSKSSKSPHTSPGRPPALFDAHTHTSMAELHSLTISRRSCRPWAQLLSYACQNPFCNVPTSSRGALAARGLPVGATLHSLARSNGCSCCPRAQLLLQLCRRKINAQVLPAGATLHLRRCYPSAQLCILLHDPTDTVAARGRSCCCHDMSTPNQCASAARGRNSAFSVRCRCCPWAQLCICASAARGRNSAFSCTIQP